MSAAPARWRAVADLLAAHRELTAIEWLECRRALVMAAVCLGVAALLGSTGWLTLNLGIVLLFRADPARAVLALALFNLVAAGLGVWQARRLLGRPFFALTRREAGTDARNLLRGFP